MLAIATCARPIGHAGAGHQRPGTGSRCRALADGRPSSTSTAGPPSRCRSSCARSTSHAIALTSDYLPEDAAGHSRHRSGAGSACRGGAGVAVVPALGGQPRLVVRLADAARGVDHDRVHQTRRIRVVARWTAHRLQHRLRQRHHGGTDRGRRTDPPHRGARRALTGLVPRRNPARVRSGQSRLRLRHRVLRERDGLVDLGGARERPPRRSG